MIKYIITAVVSVCAISGAFFYGQHIGKNAERARQSDISEAITATREAAQQGAAAEIAKIKVEHTTIQQEVQREIQTNTVYRDCRLPAGGMRAANEALTGRGAKPSGGGQLP